VVNISPLIHKEVHHLHTPLPAGEVQRGLPVLTQIHKGINSIHLQEQFFDLGEVPGHDESQHLAEFWWELLFF